MQDLKSIIRKFYTDNARTIWTIILGAIAIVLILKTLNGQAKKDIQQEETARQANIELSQLIEKETRKKLITREKDVYCKGIIKEFFNFCENGEVESAYDMISTECKNLIMPSLNDFETKYYDKIFNKKKMYKTEFYIETYDENYVYRIDYEDDILSEGRVNEDSKITDYITLVKENGKEKINVLGFIEKKSIEKEYASDEVKVIIHSKESHISYEEYDIEFINESINKVIFYEKNGTSKMEFASSTDNYKIDTNESQNIIVEKNEKKSFKIKVNKGYKNLRINKISFNRIQIGNKFLKIDIKL